LETKHELLSLNERCSLRFEEGLLAAGIENRSGRESASNFVAEKNGESAASRPRGNKRPVRGTSHMRALRGPGSHANRSNKNACTVGRRAAQLSEPLWPASRMRPPHARLRKSQSTTVKAMGTLRKIFAASIFVAKTLPIAAAPRYLHAEGASVSFAPRADFP
jgi:hypothetical protein